MKKENLQNFRIYTLLIIVAFAITIWFLVTGGYVKEGYNLRVNEVSDRQFKATRLVENKVATEKLREQAEEATGQKFKIDLQVKIAAIAKLDAYFEKMNVLRDKNTQLFIPENPPEQIGNDDLDYVDGTVAGEDAASAEGQALAEPENTSPTVHDLKMRREIEASDLSDSFTYEDLLYVVNLDRAVYEALKTNIYSIMTVTMDAKINEESMAKTLVDLKNDFQKLYQSTEPLLSDAGYDIAAKYLAPNLVYDEEVTLKLKQEARDAVVSVYYLAGQTIVNDGDIISEEAFAALESLGLISKGYIENLVPIIGVIGVTAVLFAFCFLYIFFFFDRILKNRKEGYLLFTLYIIVITAAKVVASSSVWIFIPVMAFAMLIAVLLDIRLAIVLNIGVTVITMLISNAGMQYLMFFMMSGTLTALVSRYANQRNNIFFVSLIISFASALLYASLSLVLEKSVSPELFLSTLYAFLNGFMTVMICMGSLPLWEAVFSVVTTIRLLDLTNPNNELLRRLTIEAPGTYHHSLIVANLAETASYDIKADTNIARVGGYYHDIGKLKYPQYFSENQLGENLHDDLDPYSSVQIITSHVSVGLKMAEEKKLPKPIRDIISQHHGNTLIKYFFYKEKKLNPDAEINESDFRYKQLTPQTKEAAIVMLADTVEAAVRSMISDSKSMDEVNQFIQVLIKDKLDDGQLIDSDLTIRDIDTIGKSFLRVFKGMYHERIKYPKEEEMKKSESSMEKQAELAEITQEAGE